jgi:hypothetical protein
MFLLRVWVACLALLVVVSGCKKKTSDVVETVADAQVTPAPEPAAATVDAGPPPPLTPAERLEQHRKEMADAAEAGRYGDVCKGTPWFNQTICNWVAGRAAEKAVDRPSRELNAIFPREHWKHASGHIVGDADSDGNYEVSVGGYRHHCILDTIDTKFNSKGRFDLWVQEQPVTREVTLNSGATEQWVVLEEAELAKTLMDLGHSGGGIEATAMAKNAMKLIAEYMPYTERKGELPTLPDAPVPTAMAAATPSASGGVPSLNVDALPKAGAPGAAVPPTKPSVPGPTVTPTCPAGSTCNGTSCAGNVTSCATGMHFVVGQGCVADVVALAAGTGAFDRGAAAGALGSVNPRTCRGLGAARGAGHVTVTFAPDGSVSNAVVDQPPYAGTPMAGCISNAYRMIRVPAFTGAPVTVGKTFTVN